MIGAINARRARERERETERERGGGGGGGDSALVCALLRADETRRKV